MNKENLKGRENKCNVKRVAKYIYAMLAIPLHYCRENRGKLGAIDQNEKLGLPRFSLIATKGKSERDIKRKRSIDEGNRARPLTNEEMENRMEIKRLGLQGIGGQGNRGNFVRCLDRERS